MKRRFPSVHPKLTLVLSVLFLLVSLYLLWADCGFRMPTRELALRKSAAEHALTLEDFTPHPLVFHRPESDPFEMEDFYTVRLGDRFYLAQPNKSKGDLLWRTHLYSLPLLTPWPLGSLPFWMFREEGFQQANEMTAQLVVNADPAVTRITVTGYCIPLSETVPLEELLANYSATADCVETAPGSGVWLVYLTIPKVPEATSWTYGSILRAYDAQGNLLFTNSD